MDPYRPRWKVKMKATILRDQLRRAMRSVERLRLELNVLAVQIEECRTALRQAKLVAEAWGTICELGPTADEPAESPGDELVGELIPDADE
jgi:hypothetical protein